MWSLEWLGALLLFNFRVTLAQNNGFGRTLANLRILQDEDAVRKGLKNLVGVILHDEMDLVGRWILTSFLV